MKPLVIYHDSCMDGFGAAFAAWSAMGDNVEYLPATYGPVHPADFIELVADRDVYVLDFSYPRPIMELLFEHAHSVVWLDHHKTAFEMWCPGESTLYVSSTEWRAGKTTPYIILDNNKSGALLAWEYFCPVVEIPTLFKIIDDRDRWQFKFPDTKAISAAIFAQRPWSFEQWSHEFLPIDMGNYKTTFEATAKYSSLRKMGEMLLKAHDEQVMATADRAGMACEVKWIDNSGMCQRAKGLAANCPPNLTSDVGHELATRSGTYALLWRMDKDGKIKCSLRSNGDYDVTIIAKQFGGGGHKNAAGFEIDVSELLSWLQK